MKKGTVVATIKTAHIIPPKLAPKQMNTNNNKPDREIPEKTHEQLEKLFPKLDLGGMKNWTEEQKDQTHQLFEEYHHLFALEDLE